MRQLLPDGQRQGPAQKAGAENGDGGEKSCFLEYSLMDLQGNTSAPRNIGMFRGAA
ncbi:hypothetical protein M5E88_03250 [Akkermansia muciniphila]|nr:hypothetical protein M5E88_03250 [Akkermansia muciniphila]